MTSDDSTASAVGLPSRSVGLALGGDGRAQHGVLEPVTEVLGQVDQVAETAGPREPPDVPGSALGPARTTGTTAGSAPGGTGSPALGTGTSLTPSGKHILMSCPALRCRVAWCRCMSSSSAVGGWARGSPSGLVEQGHTVSIIDKVTRAFRRLPADWPGTSIVGSGFDRDDLDRAGAKQAGALAAVTSGDNSNILTARIARENYGIQTLWPASTTPGEQRSTSASGSPPSPR